MSNQLGCCSSSTTSPPADCKDQQLAMPAWVTSHVSYRCVRGGVAQCGGPGRTDHSSPKEIAARVMRPCLAHRVVDAAASEQDDVASVEICFSRLLAPSVLPETRSWAARQPHWRPQWAEAADGRTTRARKCTEVRAPPCKQSLCGIEVFIGFEDRPQRAAIGAGPSEERRVATLASTRRRRRR